jgi:hypothetical protein
LGARYSEVNGIEINECKICAAMCKSTRERAPDSASGPGDYNRL